MILSFLGKKKRKLREDYAKFLNKKIRENMYTYFRREEIPMESMGITSVDTKEEDEITVTVTLERPGQLIGTRGTRIEGLTGFLNTRVESPKKIKVEIVESNIWSDFK